jgi:hypothetical protein
MKRYLFVMTSLALACSTPVDQDVLDGMVETRTVLEVVAEVEISDAVLDVSVDLTDEESIDAWIFDTAPETPFEVCGPGEGCFLDPCSDNQQCQSGWCVEHMGDGVCTQECTEECPPGWNCKQVGLGGPDFTFICVSSHANLCRPCSSGADCKSTGGIEDLCLQYGDAGSFCGGSCTVDDDCPWGFSCQEATTVDGVSATQCLADAGVCPCTEKSVSLALFTPCENQNEFGTCSGKRFCTVDGLSDCDASIPMAEICNGLDDDCDGSSDEPEEFEGKLLLPCDDNNPCTEDACFGEDGCTYTPLTEGECLDGDACTIGDHCEEGVCVGAPIDCDDDNPCTDDVCDGLGGCDFLPNSADCDDSDPCTVADTCKDSVCVGYAVECDCTVDADCGKFDDGDPCTGTLLCNQNSLPYQCQVDPATVVKCDPPEGPDAFCLASICNPESGTCETVSEHQGLACDDNDACTVGESCQDGACIGGVPTNCNDGNPCTDDACLSESGCVYTDNQSSCQDGDACTIGDECQDGDCVPGLIPDCNDNNPCTDDTCDSNSGCMHVANTAACNDGNECSTGDHCESGDCVSVSSLDCDDKNPCTDDSCTPSGGCQHVPNTAPCSDQNACTANDTCFEGLCSPGVTMSCNDGNPCTDDSCDQQFGCLYAANALACNDGNECTLADTCKAGTCQSNVALSCQDDNVCTTDSCSPEQGCVHSLNSAPCDDGDLCTTKDQCQLGECVGSQPAQCNDNNPCTDDACAPKAGCTFVPNQATCDDGNACTTDDACVKGWCQGATLICNDQNLCTDDSCEPLTGCQFTPNEVPCDDGDACTSGDICAAGECAGPEGVNCDDSNVCTDDSCDSESGCVNTNNNESCDDSNECTVTDVCNGGGCAGSGEPDCDDGEKCTTDTCDTIQGCLHTPITPCCGNAIKEGGEECDDGNEEDGDDCKSDCTEPSTNDWRIGTWNSQPVYGVKNCNSGDYDCQAKDACEQATGATCVWQSYNCSGYPNENGSYYPTSNPLGRSVSTSGSSNLNWAVTSGCAVTNDPCTHGDDSVYGNLCCCDCPTPNQLWHEGNDWCGVGIWEPY